ncbi:MAG: DUF805 domain-containing protein [Propionibacteriaceae bacterium]|jgi:uncharacterized membrane protein YhaH (DUF805 family)|nr:DUF805 domain-containing protein [Propionibacteriaceae bacterium]
MSSHEQAAPPTEERSTSDATTSQKDQSKDDQRSRSRAKNEDQAKRTSESSERARANDGWWIPWLWWWSRDRIGFWAALRRFIASARDRDGRATRAEYWWVVLGLTIAQSAFLVLGLVTLIAAAIHAAIDLQAHCQIVQGPFGAVPYCEGQTPPRWQGGVYTALLIANLAFWAAVTVPMTNLRIRRFRDVGLAPRLALVPTIAGWLLVAVAVVTGQVWIAFLLVLVALPVLAAAAAPRGLFTALLDARAKARGASEGNSASDTGETTRQGTKKRATSKRAGQSATSASSAGDSDDIDPEPPFTPPAPGEESLIDDDLGTGFVTWPQR